MLFDCDSVQSFLAQQLAHRVRVNPRYSQRAFARSLGLSPGELSELMRGKRNLSLRSALKISKSMGLNPTEVKYLLHLSQLDKSRGMTGHEIMEDGAGPQLTSMGQDLSFLLSEWYYLAIINLADCQNFRWDAGWIARQLGLSRTQVKLAMERMTKAGLVKSEYGRVQVGGNVEFNIEKIPSHLLRNYHRQMLHIAERALELQKAEEREISGIGFACDPKDLVAMKKDINEFLDKMVAKYSRGKKKEVYFIQANLFRLSQGEGGA